MQTEKVRVPAKLKPPTSCQISVVPFCVCPVALHGDTRPVCRASPNLSVVSLTVLYWTAESDVPGNASRAVATELALLLEPAASCPCCFVAAAIRAVELRCDMV